MRYRVGDLMAGLRGQGRFKDSVRSGRAAPAQRSVVPQAWAMEEVEQFTTALPDYGSNQLQEGGASKVPRQAYSLPTSDDSFINTLDAKLKSLEKEKKKKKKGARAVSFEHRPMFITTVKTGIFLDPPPELAALLGYSKSSNASSGSTGSQKSGVDVMYSFSSQPRVLNNNRPKPKVSNARQEEVNIEKQKSRNNLRVKRDLASVPNDNPVNQRKK